MKETHTMRATVPALEQPETNVSVGKFMLLFIACFFLLEILRSLAGSYINPQSTSHLQLGVHAAFLTIVFFGFWGHVQIQRHLNTIDQHWIENLIAANHLKAHPLFQEHAFRNAIVGLQDFCSVRALVIITSAFVISLIGVITFVIAVRDALQANASLESISGMPLILLAISVAEFLFCVGLIVFLSIRQRVRFRKVRSEIDGHLYAIFAKSNLSEFKDIDGVHADQLVLDSEEDASNWTSANDREPDANGDDKDDLFGSEFNGGDNPRQNSPASLEEEVSF